MKSTLVLLILGLTAMFFLAKYPITPSLQEGTPFQAEDEQYLEQFHYFKALHGKKYNTPEEEQLRFAQFVENLIKIRLFNTPETQEVYGATLKMNKFGDLPLEEFKALYLGRRPNKKIVKQEQQQVTDEIYVETFKVEADPTSVNWTAKGAVTPVKDQGQCGSCWAFSTVGGLEGIYAIKSGHLQSFSEQQIVDCSTANYGCDGGDLPPAYEYVVKNGIETEAEYPYKAKDGSCKYSKSQVVFTPQSYTEVTPNSPKKMVEAVVTQPLSVCIEADSFVFQFYSNGVLKSAACGTNLDHCVTLTGYNDNAATAYWEVKNSWGTSWGNNGYIWIYKNMNLGAGVCGINEEPVYPNWNGQ